MTFRDIARALLRHKKKALSFFVGVMALVATALVFWPRTYYSEAVLFVHVGRQSVALDPTATMGQTIGLAESRESEINSILRVFESRSMLEQVVDRLGIDTIMAGARDSATVDAEHSATNGLSARLAQIRSLVPPMDPIGPHEQAVDKLESSISIYAPKRSHVISISATAGSPELAQSILGTLIDVYQNEHLRIHRTSGSYEFFADQSDLARSKLERASEELRAVKNSMGLASIESQQRILEERISTIETERARAESALAAAEQKIIQIRAALSHAPERTETDSITGLPNVAADDMRKQLYELEVRQQELHAKYTQAHPLVVEIDAQVESARQIVDDQVPEREQLTTTLNPIHQELQSNLLLEESNATAQRAQIRKLDDLRAGTREELAQLNDHELRIAQLERNRDLLDANFQTYAEKLEQSRIGRAIENERISNVNVVQPANYVARPVSPKKRLILALGLAVATFGAIGVALLFETLDQSFRTPEEVEEELRVPVLLSVPRMPRSRVTLN